MKNREIFAEMRCIPPVVVRADGRNFRNTLSGLGFKKPYDQTFARALVYTAELLDKKERFKPSLCLYFFGSNQFSIYGTFIRRGRWKKSIPSWQVFSFKRPHDKFAA